MIRINLLPHRAESRKARQIQFIAFGVISLLLGLVLVGIGAYGLERHRSSTRSAATST